LVGEYNNTKTCENRTIKNYRVEEGGKKMKLIDEVIEKVKQKTLARQSSIKQ